MAGETDLGVLLASLQVARRPGRFTLVSVPESPALGDGIEAVVHEDEGVTVVCTTDRAHDEGWSIDFEAAWLTLDVHSSLEAVGLTATVAAALADVAIPANVIAGYYHDHLLVPADRAAEAVACLNALAARSQGDVDG